MRRLVATFFMATAAAGPLAQTAPEAPAAQSVQQAFDAATALSDAGKNAEALVAWDVLETRVTRNARTRAIVRLRKGLPLLRLRRLDEAAASIRAGLAALPATDATLVQDRTDALLALGVIAKAGLDYAGAVEHYRAAAMIAPTPVYKLSALLGEVSAQTFVDPEAGLATVAAIETMISGTSTDARSKAIAKIAISELNLNLGRFETAHAAAREAVRLLGGLTLRLDLLDVAARGNVALAALKLGKRDEAREYLRYTGAGNSKTNINPAQQLVPPDCGADTGLRPDDIGVIEFSVSDEGEVIDSAPVYASRQGQAALAFARAARGWSWTADKLKELPAFFRTRVRVEIRCSTAFQRPSVGSLLSQDLAGWFESKGVKFDEVGSSSSFAARLREDRARLAEARGAGSGAATAAALYLVAANPSVGTDETATLAREALAIATREGAPPAARLMIERLIWQSVAEGDQSRRYRDALAAALTAEPYAGDPTARAALSLFLVEALGRRDLDRSRQLLRQVGEGTALPPAHPLKVGALVRLASLEQGKGEVAAARSAFERTGLSAQQCALLDAPPRLRALNAGASAYPREAVGWGFEGWVRAQLDVDAEGRPVNPRVVVAYPAFVFSDATIKMANNARWEKSFRPDGGLGCGGLPFPVRFQMTN
jgi:tetratricopeptide (TPR) repeat protein